MRTNKAAVIGRICDALGVGRIEEAVQLARAEYPFEPAEPTKRTYTPLQSMRVFLRDGFVDRYTGDRLVYPPVLRLLGQVLPEEFPMHPNWKMTETHMAYWDLFPTVDHVAPVSRGGLDQEENWVCTSMRSNQAKLNRTLEELGWTLHPAGDLKDWDGLTRWFLGYAESHPEALDSEYQRKWHSAAVRALDAA